MNRHLKIWIAISALAGLLLLGIAEQSVGKGGISGSGILRGKLQRFASIVLNDTELSTTQAVVRINSAPTSVNALRVGQQLHVTTAAIQLGHADQIDYFSEAIGPITAVNPLTETFRVLGQDVTVAGVTNLENIDFAALRVGRWVEVSGLRRGTNAILATFVRLVPATSRVRLTGVVQSLGPQNQVSLSGFAVNASAALRTGVAVGDLISVGGVFGPNRTSINAQQLVELPPLAATSANLVSREGFVTAFANPVVRVDGIAFQLTNLTRYVNGTRSDIQVGKRLHIETSKLANGNSRVDTVVFRPERRLDIEGPLLSIESITSSSARIIVGGLSILITQGTDFSPSSNASNDANSINDLQVGDYLKLRGYVDGEELATARLDRTQFDDEVRFDSVVRGYQTSAVLLAGARVVTNSQTEFRLSGGKVSRAQFVAAVSEGAIVEVRYRNFSVPTQAADRITLLQN